MSDDEKQKIQLESKYFFLHSSGIVGLGRIGQTVQKMLQPFGVEQFLYTGRNKIASELENGAKFQTFEELLRKSDFVIVTCALTPDTKDKFNQEAFDLMKPTSVLINTSRGGMYVLVFSSAKL